MTETLRKKEFFDAVAPRWISDQEQRTMRLEEIFEREEIPFATPLLDVGGGVGILLPLLRERSVGSIVEYEISREMITRARDAHEQHGGIAFVQGDAHWLPFPDNHFASVHCFSVFPHFTNPAQAQAEIHRCLRPGGTLCILHLMGHHELNAMHRKAGECVSRDVLLPVDRLAGLMRPLGFDVLHAEERSDLYLLVARKLDRALA